MTAPNAPPKRRRWLSFSLRALLLATAAIAIWLGFKMAAARRQHAAVEGILASGGTVGYDYQEFDGWLNKDAEFPVPQWLRSLAGDDFFVTPIEMSLNGEQATDELIETSVSQLPNIKWVYVKDGNVTGRALKSLQKLKQLEALRIIGLNAVPEDLRGFDSSKFIKFMLLLRDPKSEITADQLSVKTDVEFIEYPLAEVMSFLFDKHRIPIQIVPALDDRLRRVGVTYAASGEHLREVLSAIMKSCKSDYVVRYNADGAVLTPAAQAREKWPAYEMLKTMFPNAETDADW